MRIHLSSLVAALGISAVFFISPAGGMSPQTPQDRIEALEKKVGQLEDRVKGLERALKNFEEEHRYFALPGLPPGLKNVPPDWKPFTFNGQKFYLVPLKNIPKQGAKETELKKD